MSQEKKHPWQRGSTELIQYSIKHLRSNNDFDKRRSFLILDIGIETLLKTYLELPAEITGTKTSFTKRQEAIAGNFHSLVQGVKDAAGERIKNINLEYIQYYHNKRNQLYHDGEGLTIQEDHLLGYLQLAVPLMKALLDVDLAAELEAELAEIEKRKATIQHFEKLLETINSIDRHEDLLLEETRNLKELLVNFFASHEFEEKLTEITSKYSLKQTDGVREDNTLIQSERISPKPAIINEYFGELKNLLDSIVVF